MIIFRVPAVLIQMLCYAEWHRLYFAIFEFVVGKLISFMEQQTELNLAAWHFVEPKYSFHRNTIFVSQMYEIDRFFIFNYFFCFHYNPLLVRGEDESPPHQCYYNPPYVDLPATQYIVSPVGAFPADHAIEPEGPRIGVVSSSPLPPLPKIMPR